MAINDQTLHDDVFLSIRDTLIAEGISYDGTTAQVLNVLSSEYDGSKPTITISPLDKDERMIVFGSNEGEKIINIPITVYYKTTGGVDSLSSQVEYALKHSKIAGLSLNQLISNFEEDVLTNTPYNAKTITAVYNRAEM